MHLPYSISSVTLQVSYFQELSRLVLHPDRIIPWWDSDPGICSEPLHVAWYKISKDR